jgi:acetyltransferase
MDYYREMAFIATKVCGEGKAETLGVVRAIANPDHTSAEFAIVVRSDTKSRGPGHAPLEKMIGYCRSRGTLELTGQVLPENRSMLELARRCGFESRRVLQDRVVELRLQLLPA